MLTICTVAVAAALMPSEDVSSDVVLIYVADVTATPVMVTTISHTAPAATVPPENLITPGVAIFTIPPHCGLTAEATVNPVGRVSVKLVFVASTTFAELSILNVRVNGAFESTWCGVKNFVKTGGVGVCDTCGWGIQHFVFAQDFACLPMFIIHKILCV